MAKLIVQISDPKEKISYASFNNLNTPQKRKRGCVRVINIMYYEKETDYTKLAKDICHQSNDIYYGHQLVVEDGDFKETEYKKPLMIKDYYSKKLN